jgi:hypothetical protein
LLFFWGGHADFPGVLIGIELATNLTEDEQSCLTDMPQSGDKNTSFGIYESDCCGQEIVITHGATFPHCPKHKDRRTEWIAINESDRVIRLVVFPQKVLISHSDI